MEANTSGSVDNVAAVVTSRLEAELMGHAHHPGRRCARTIRINDILGVTETTHHHDASARLVRQTCSVHTGHTGHTKDQEINYT